MIAHKAMEAGCAMSELVERTFDGDPPPVESGRQLITVSPATYAMAIAESERRGCSVGTLIADILPGTKHPVAPCRNCGKTMRQPTLRHRWHRTACVLYADRDMKGTT